MTDVNMFLVQPSLIEKIESTTKGEQKIQEVSITSTVKGLQMYVLLNYFKKHLLLSTF